MYNDDDEDTVWNTEMILQFHLIYNGFKYGESNRIINSVKKLEEM